MRPVGATMEFAQFPICTHEGREAGRLRPRPFAALLPTKEKRAPTGNKPDQRPNDNFHRETFREITGSERGLRMKYPCFFLTFNLIRFEDNRQSAKDQFDRGKSTGSESQRRVIRELLDAFRLRGWLHIPIPCRVRHRQNAVFHHF